MTAKTIVASVRVPPWLLAELALHQEHLAEENGQTNRVHPRVSSVIYTAVEIYHQRFVQPDPRYKKLSAGEARRVLEELGVRSAQLEEEPEKQTRLSELVAKASQKSIENREFEQKVEADNLPGTEGEES